MAKEIVQADLGRIRALLDEVLGHSDYSDVQRMGGLTNRTYCVTFADGSRIMVRIPGEGTEELIDRADEKVSTELACRLGIDAKLYFFGDDGEKVSQFVPNAVTMSAETMRGDKRIRQAAQLLKTLHGSGVDTGVPFEVFDMAAGYEKIIEENSVPMFGDYAQVKAAVMAVKAQIDSVCDIQNVPCHNDPLCENWVVSADDDRLYLIDWEYAGMNDGIWDLADVSIEGVFTPENDELLLTEYLGSKPDQNEYKHFLANKIYVDYLWTLWAKTRVPYDGQPMEDWAVETIILGIALSMAPFVSTEQAIFLAPFVSTFIHDAFSALWAALYNGVRGNLKNVYKAAFKTKSGKFVMLAAVIGGPIGMTGYVLAINYMGASIGAVASAVFPAIGAILAYFFLKEKMQWYRWIFLLATLLGVYGLSYSPELNITDFWLGIVGAMMCAFGWGIEAVILAKCMQDPDVKDEYALQIRQTTSALVYGIVLLPLLHGWGFTVSLFTSGTGWLLPVIAIAAFFATLSYLCYYRAIAAIGASKSMALNVTYAAWAIFFTAVFLGDTSVLTPTTIICALIVIVCGILTAADGKDLFSKSKA